MNSPANAPEGPEEPAALPPADAAPRRCPVALCSFVLAGVPYVGLVVLHVAPRWWIQPWPINHVIYAVVGLTAVILGHWALGRIKRSGGLVTGKGLAWAGLIAGCLAVATVHLNYRHYRDLFNETYREMCISNLRQMDGAKEIWARDKRKTTADTPVDSDIFGAEQYLREKPTCWAGGTYKLHRVGLKPTCTIPGHTNTY